MKKFIIVTLMCALLAGAAFAQGWSVSGRGELGTMLNFVGGGHEAIDETKADVEEDGNKIAGNYVPVTLIGANTYHNIEYYGYIGGLLSLRYNNAGLSAGFDFVGQRAHDTGGRIDGEINYGGPNARFQYVQAILGAFDKDSSTGVAGSDGSDVTKYHDLLHGNFAPDRLWGLYNLMDGRITLEAAAASRDNNFWYSSGVVDTLFGGGSNIINRQTRISGEIGFDNTFGMGFAKVDHHNYLVVNTALIDGLEAGVMFPNVFAFYKPKNNYEGGHSQYSGSSANNAGTPGYYDAQEHNAHELFLNDTLLKTRIGVKYASGPFNAALQFAFLGTQRKNQVLTGDWYPDWKIDDTDKALESVAKDSKGKALTPLKSVAPVSRKVKGDDGKEFDSFDVFEPAVGLYVGANYAINDQISAGLGFQGHFWSQKPTLGFGANVGFGSGPINAGLALGLWTKIDPTERYAYSNAKLPGEREITNGASGNYERKKKVWDYDTSKSKDDETWTVINGTESIFALKPQVSYAIVENYLAASLETSLFFKVGVHDASWQPNQVGYEITPQIFFNVDGTGAATNYYGGLNTAIIVRYKIAGWADGSDLAAWKKQFKGFVDIDDAEYNTIPKYHGLDITFKWTF